MRYISIALLGLFAVGCGSDSRQANTRDLRRKALPWQIASLAKQIEEQRDKVARFERCIEDRSKEPWYAAEQKKIADKWVEDDTAAKTLFGPHHPWEREEDPAKRKRQFHRALGVLARREGTPPEPDDQILENMKRTLSKMEKELKELKAEQAVLGGAENRE